MRADLFLHHIRTFKSRTLAAQACDKGNVRLGGNTVKPARDLKPGDVLEVERGALKLVLRIIGLPAKRVGAPLVSQYVENLTPPENHRRASEARREMRWSGTQEGPKPDKKQLRQIREWLDQREVP